MKKILKKLFLSGIPVVLFMVTSCATNNFVQEGDEYIEYRNVNYESAGKSKLTEKELREDIDYIKYIFYNAYAGVDEAIQQGFDLDKVCNQILTEMLAKKDFDGKFSSKDLSAVVYTTFGSNFPLPDQHIWINGRLKENHSVYLSNVYFEKQNDTFVVSKSEEEKVAVGKKYAGKPENLIEYFIDGRSVYRFGVIINKNIKTANLILEDQSIMVPVKTEKPIPAKSAWYNVKESKETAYISLSECSDVYGLMDENQFVERFFNEYLEKVCAAMPEKKHLIFDLRSNSGGYVEYPIKMITTALYYNHSQEEKDNITAYLINSIREGCKNLDTPVTMQKRKKVYEESSTIRFTNYSQEFQDYCKTYWKKMKTYPVRRFSDAIAYSTNFTELPEPDFKGDFYILLNRYSASASELSTAAAFNFVDLGMPIYLVGENSCGAVKYVGMYSYFTPNSYQNLSIGMEVGLSPIFDKIAQFKGEAKGFHPDFWVTNETILPTLINQIQDQELETVLAGLDKNQL